jgi:hypothetical protein
MWDFVVDKVAPGQVSPAKFIPPIAKKIIIIIINQSSGICTIGQLGKTSMAAVQGTNRYLGT